MHVRFLPVRLASVERLVGSLERVLDPLGEAVAVTPAENVTKTCFSLCMKRPPVSARCSRVSTRSPSSGGVLGQQDDELLAAVTRDLVARAQVLLTSAASDFSASSPALWPSCR